ncbi:hypothetical protein KZX37_00660 [Microbacterium sp. EYE_5]|uniref:hypothetical protein n=1 Tax=unclassified Microbacterium TaxID=2609290 RepID=UPI00200305C5|nr:MULTISPECIES: hypothetical protein [unclassified Microbacterium]MCK6079125.1 hypothetical protein [Microbacterium sp. EYE_382]MCK6084395.1 hypothetical protein [Microbacterium sp. EYE_384]MCK6123376.1 hypothetical protein [Microbacterium sp. EYE_80]MCK6125159.1 hypothetical protein [Microbacterium sp. EYE_79]MCK6140079.1 hypothetical protein [Microbacterium sp. EYE_39]
MARVGGRNSAFAWIVGVVSAAVVVALLVFAVPMFPAATGWITDAVGQAQRAIDPDAAAPVASEPSPSNGAITGSQYCRELYDAALWAELDRAPGAERSATSDAPASTATELVAALEPAVTMTCLWTSELGEVSTTVATVPTDAGAIAAAALPRDGFECESGPGRTRCERTDGDLLETIEARGDTWVSTSQHAWHPTRYADEVAGAVFAD